MLISVKLMGKKIIILLFVLIFVLLIFADADEISKEKISVDVKEDVQSGEKVKVFVNLKDDTDFRVFSEKEGIREDFIEDIGKSKVKYKFEDSVSMEIGEEDLEKLERDPRVKSVERVGFRQIFLQDSVEIINGTQTYPLQVGGINLTGKDNTICIIDSGVNYTHPDLGGCLGDGCKIWGGWDYVNGDSDPMDDNGHGTHVSGIASANGTINGVAPESRIIMIKACDSSGICADDAIMSGIDWCVNNATKFNISVISMSLGSGLNTGYCNSDPLATKINSAVSAGISVVIASGNNNNVSAIAAPACVESATPVGAVNKVDSLIYNRNALVKIVAPGVGINSTYLSATEYGLLSGTSMSTPHVAGAIAILKQVLDLTSQSKTPGEIENIFSGAGKIIEDSNGINYSRINIYNSIISMDNVDPDVALISPINNSISPEINQTFSCNATDLELSNVTFYLWNSSGIYNTSERTGVGALNVFEINISNLPADNYEWNCLYSDKNDNSAFASSNFSLEISGVVVTLVSPLDNLFTKGNQTFSCNATDLELSNVTFYLWNSSDGLVNSSLLEISGTSNSTEFSYNFTYEDSYKWNCLFVNNQSSESFASSNYSISYDVTNPELEVISPLNNTWYSVGRFNVSLSENGSCLYSLDSGVSNFSMSSGDDRDFSAIYNNLSQGIDYNISFYCNDSAGNLNLENRNFNIDLTKPNVSSISPVDGYSVSGETAISFDYNVSDDLNISKCELVLNGSVSSSNLSIVSNGTNSILYSVPVGVYIWRINCTDVAENIGNSSLKSLTVNSVTSNVVTSSGGGGGSPASSDYIVSESQASEGYIRKFKKDDRIFFEIFDEKFIKHSLSVDYIGDNFVNLTIRSEPINVVLGVGQSIKINLTSEDYYDLFIKLEEISNGRATLIIQTIRDLIPGEKIEEEKETLSVEKLSGGNDEEIMQSSTYFYGFRILLISMFLTLFIFLIILFFIWKKEFRKEVREEVVKEIKKKLKK